MVYATEIGLVIGSVLITITIITVFNRIKHGEQKEKVHRSHVTSSYVISESDFKNSRREIYLLIYRTQQSVAAMPFETGEAARQWALMIVQNSRKIWALPEDRTDDELLKNWTNETCGCEFITISKINVKSFIRRNSKTVRY